MGSRSKRCVSGAGVSPCRVTVRVRGVVRGRGVAVPGVSATRSRVGLARVPARACRRRLGNGDPSAERRGARRAPCPRPVPPPRRPRLRRPTVTPPPQPPRPPPRPAPAAGPRRCAPYGRAGSRGAQDPGARRRGSGPDTRGESADGHGGHSPAGSPDPGPRAAPRPAPRRFLRQRRGHPAAPPEPRRRPAAPRASRPAPWAPGAASARPSGLQSLSHLNLAHARLAARPRRC